MSNEFKLVPLVASDEMDKAIREVISEEFEIDISYGSLSRLYDAILNAAPQPPALGGDHKSQRSILRAMARNYRNGHSWDHLDGEACIKAADEIDRLNEKFAQLKTRCDELEALLGSIRIYFAPDGTMGNRIEATLSKPAGSEKV